MNSLKITTISIQYEPELGKIAKNIGKLKIIISSISEPIDIIIFPELSLTGYNFKDQNQLKECSEKAGAGPHFHFATETAIKIKAYVFLGYPEEDESSYYNSLYCVDPTGKLILNYRKKQAVVSFALVSSHASHQTGGQDTSCSMNELSPSEMSTLRPTQDET